MNVETEPSDEATSASRREEPRTAFYRPVSIRHQTGVALVAYATNVSPSGIGLVHTMPLTVGHIDITAEFTEGRKSIVPAELLWSKPVNGYYISGARVIGDDTKMREWLPTSEFPAQPPA